MYKPVLNHIIGRCIFNDHSHYTFKERKIFYSLRVIKFAIAQSSDHHVHIEYICNDYVKVKNKYAGNPQLLFAFRLQLAFVTC